MASGDVIVDAVTTVSRSASEDSFFPVGTVLAAGWSATLKGNQVFTMPNGTPTNVPREFDLRVMYSPYSGQPDADVPLDQSKQYRVTVTEV